MVLSRKAAMRVVILVAVFLEAVTAAPKNGMLASLSPFEHTEHTIPEEYIVVFKKDANQVHIEDHMVSINDMLATLTNSNYSVKHTYHFSSFRGYSARMDDQTLDHVRSMQEVDYVERNQRYSVTECETQKDATWGLSRISHKDKQTKDYTYIYDKGMQGKGVDIYIIDSGIAVDNPQFKTDGVQRAEWGADYVAKKGDKDHYEKDESGHGTAVAGVAMSNDFGVAKLAKAIAVRVMNSEGIGKMDDAIEGFEYVYKQRKEGKTTTSAVINASFGGPTSKALSWCIIDMIELDVLVVASAGNDGKNAAYYSPASDSFHGSVTVASCNKDDELAPNSNYGDLVTIIAPGVEILTTGHNASMNYPNVKKSGTSFAAPFVTGVVANMLSNDKKLTPEKLKKTLEKQALEDVIKLSDNAKKADSKTPNLLLKHLC